METCLRVVYLEDVLEGGRVSKPSVFVGSSAEGLEVARAVQVQLIDTGDVQLWNEGVFSLSLGFFESLTQALTRFDFAVLVLTADDVVVSRNIEQRAARDNVLIELGLFTGRLGRDRTFLVSEVGEDVKVPSDLAGVVFATFSRPADETTLISAVGPACVHVRDAIRKQGKAEDVTRLAEAVEENERRVSDQQQQLGAQQEIINQLVKYSMSASVFHHLCGVSLLHRYFYRNNEPTQREFYFLRDSGFIRPTSQGFVDFGAELDGANLPEIVEPTPIGWLCIRLRRDEIPSNMISDSANLKVDLATL
jgi:hypothetical protein